MMNQAEVQTLVRKEETLAKEVLRACVARGYKKAKFRARAGAAPLKPLWAASFWL